ncbi:MAG TPA: hypothetical protein VHU13_10155 [Solirubrobacteraceae bacterium]|jgi:hypothetical protein|nr:hypothetical protein [Solirubrobacteraceae bacterium]
MPDAGHIRISDEERERLLGPGSDLDAFEARLQARHEKALARERLRRHYRGRLLP